MKCSAPVYVAHRDSSWRILPKGIIWTLGCLTGVQAVLQVEQAQIHAGRVKALFVTHLHGDHCFGIPGLLRSVSSAREGTPLASEAFRIFGPPGLRALVTSALAFDATPLCMPLVSLCDDYPVALQNAGCSKHTHCRGTPSSYGSVGVKKATSNVSQV